MSESPSRRWFRFSLRTLFLAITVFACWLGYELNWIRQRQAWRDPGSGAVRATAGAAAPGFLWIFGEHGEYWIELRNGTDERVAVVQRLFPEANVVIARQQPKVGQLKPIDPRYAPPGPPIPAPVP